MSEARGRSRSAPAQQQGRGSRTGSRPANDDWGRRGSGGMETVRQEREAAAARRDRPFEPFRFFLKKNTSTEITILDDSLEDAWFMYEHAIPGQGMDWSKTTHEACPREFEECPICAKAAEDHKGRFGNSVYMTFLTVIENYGNDPYIDRNGVAHYFAKRLLALKPGQLEDYERIFEVVKKNEGTLRGLTLIVERGNGETSSRVGKPTINDNGQMYEMLSEEQLDEYYGNDEERDERGQVIKAANENIAAYDYKSFFPRPSAADIATRWPMLSVGTGSQADIDRTLREGEDAPARGRGGSRNTRVSRDEPTGTTGARGRGRTAPADVDDDPPEDAPDNAPPARGRTRGAASAPANDPPPRGRGRAVEQETQQPRGRTAAPATGRGAPPTGRGAPPAGRGTGRGAPPTQTAGRSRAGTPVRGRSMQEDMDDDIPF